MAFVERATKFLETALASSETDGEMWVRPTHDNMMRCALVLRGGDPEDARKTYDEMVKRLGDAHPEVAPRIASIADIAWDASVIPPPVARRLESLEAGFQAVLKQLQELTRQTAERAQHADNNFYHGSNEVAISYISATIQTHSQMFETVQSNFNEINHRTSTLDKRSRDMDKRLQKTDRLVTGLNKRTRDEVTDVFDLLANELMGD
jgi:hypothetical protein